MDNIRIYQDDICLAARTREELKNKTEQVLRRLKHEGMIINRDKYKLDCEKISYLGYQISREGISPDERRTNKIAKTEKPTNKKELESFLELINFYNRYLPRYSELIEPFAEMREKKKHVEFTWTQKQNKPFEASKKALTSKPVIKIFDPKKEVTLTTDARERVIAAVVSQEGHPIMYQSRKLSSAESNYSNIEKEGLAIAWSMESAQNFLCGKKFLKSDHKSLKFLFNPRKELTRLTSSRSLRWAIKIMVFDLDIIYVKGNSISHVDALSRIRFLSENGEEHENSEDRIIQWVETDVLSRKTLNETHIRKNVL